MVFWSLPEGWQWKPIQDLARDTERRNPTHDPKNEFIYVDIGSVDNVNGEIRLDETKSILGENAPSRARKVIKHNNVIFATTRPYLMNIALVPEVLDNQMCSTGFCVLSPIEGLANPKFIYYLCRSKFFIDQLIPKQRGASYPAVTDSDVYDTLIPVPYPDNPLKSLRTQNAIVARVEILSAELAEIRRLSESIINDIKILKKSTIINSYEDANKNSQNSEQILLDQESLDIKSGFACAKKNVVPIGIPHLRPFNIDAAGEIIITNETIIIPDTFIQDFDQYKLLPGDVLFNNTNSVELVGKSGIVREEMAVAFSNHIYRLRIKEPNKITSGWLLLSLKYLFESGFFAKNCNKWIGQAGFNQTKLSEIQVSLPKSEIQRKIFSHVEQVINEAKELEASIQSDLHLLGDLEQSILLTAFTGGL